MTILALKIYENCLNVHGLLNVQKQSNNKIYKSSKDYKSILKIYVKYKYIINKSILFFSALKTIFFGYQNWDLILYGWPVMDESVLKKKLLLKKMHLFNQWPRHYWQQTFLTQPLSNYKMMYKKTTTTFQNNCKNSYWWLILIK